MRTRTEPMTRAYLELKIARELFSKPPEELGDAERRRLDAIADRQATIEQRVLGCRESAGVVVPPEAVAERLGAIRARYEGDGDYQADLARLGLDESGLEQTLARELRVEAVLERVAARTPPVSAVDAELYYHSHPEAFERPETRRLRHILVTWSNRTERRQAASLLAGLRLQLATAEAFGEAALRHSHCPTAMQGGQLGLIRRGQLFPELEPAAFALPAGAVSEPLESPVGLHLVRCDEILPAARIPFDDVAAKIAERIAERRKAQAQREWLLALERAAGAA